MLDLLYVTPNFYRQFGYQTYTSTNGLKPYRFKRLYLYSKAEILNVVHKLNGICDCYISLSEYKVIDSKLVVIPRFFLIDFDKGNGFDFNDVDDDVSTTTDWLEDNKISYVLNRSGAKGYHVLVPLYFTVPATNLNFKSFHNYIRSHLKLKTIDNKCAEIMRVFRIPNTINMKSGKICKTVDIFEANKLNIVEYNTQNHKNIQYENCHSGENHYGFPFPYVAPCIDSKINNDDVSHDVRWIWTKIQQGKGKSFEQIFNEARRMKWSDYDEDITKYQISYTLKSPCTISCRLIKEKGLCLGNKCHFYIDSEK